MCVRCTVSGGSWFSSQMVYSGRFYTSVTDTSRSMAEVVEEWGVDYSRVIRKSIRDGSLKTIDKELDSNSCQGSCTATRRLLAMTLDFLLQLTELPLIEWEPWVGTFLSPYINKAYHHGSANARYNTSANGLSSVTLVQGLVLPPDAFMPNAAQSSGRERATLMVSTVDPNDGYNQSINRWTVPLAWVRPGYDTRASLRLEPWQVALSDALPEALNSCATGFSGFNIPDGISALNLSVEGGVYPLKLPEMATISQVTGASSAAIGPTCSPTMFEFIADALAKTIPMLPQQKDLLLNAIADSFREGGSIEQCLPELLEELAVPVGDVHDPASKSRFRLLDGTFGENMGAANAISRMQQDCESYDTNLRGSLDCNRVPSLIAVDHSAGYVVQGDAHLLGGSLPPLFSSYPDPHAGFGGLIRQPSPVIFAEGYPPIDEWVQYESLQGSTFWAGELTTVDNMWYRVRGGMRIRVLMLRPSWQFRASATDGLGGTLPIPIPESRDGMPFTGGPATEEYFEERYAPKAAAEALAVQPVLSHFLSHS
eukprot:6152479-Prymnesium_polylepis.2